MFLGSYVKKMLHSSQIEGTQATLEDVAALTLYALKHKITNTWTAIVPHNLFLYSNNLKMKAL